MASRFVDGSFTQVLTMVRFNNQDSAAEQITSGKISKQDGVITSAKGGVDMNPMRTQRLFDQTWNYRSQDGTAD